MADAVAWLVAELDRVEELARAACPARGPVPGGEVWSVEEYVPSSSDAVQTGAWVVTGPDGENGVAFVQGDRRARHIVRHDPAVVLRRVAADRQILAEHANDRGDCRVCAGEADYSDDAEGNREWHRSAELWPCRTVLLLAEAWGWTEETPRRST